jgi:hypothetical protein
MNLLKVQDALKNASDQQLMALMQAPDSTAPSYLVLSEIRRRKDMRAKQAPEGQSNRTVAEDLTAPQEPVGIQGLQGQDSMDPDGVDVADGGVTGMAAGGLASLRRYREGGIVRMQAGGDIMGDIPFPTSNYEDMTVPPAFGGPGPSRPASPDYQTRLAAAQREFRRRIEENPSARIDNALHVQLAQQFRVPLSFAANYQREERARIGRDGPTISGGQGDVAPLGGDAPMRPQAGELGGPTGVQYERAIGPEPSGIQYDAAIGPQPPQRQGQQGTATTQATTTQGAPGTQGGGTPGIEGLRNAPAALPEGGQLPTMAELMRQNAALFPDGMGSIRDRMREERVDPAARRSEAVNMALIEAGLRIAGSRNPSLIGAIGEGALPAVQSYGQQLGQIRGEQREARRDELELAKQETNRQFAIGQISAAEYRSRMENINRTLQVNAMERGANARLVASENAADRRAAAAAESERNRLLIEENRDRRARDLADLQERRRMRERAAIAANEAFGNLGTREMVRQALKDEARRANPNERNPTISDQAVQDRILRDTIARIEQAYQITPPGSRGGGSGNDPFSVR